MEIAVPKDDVTRKPETTGEAQCPNCGAEVLGPYCFQCGQRYVSHVAPLRSLFSEVLDEVFSLDNRLWRTLKMLVLRPGHLTEAYINGQQIRYVSPLRLYLIFSVFYFFVAALVGRTNFLFIHFNMDESTVDLAKVLPRIMFVIVPGIALLLKGLYRRQRRLYAEHLIFALHVHAFWFILFTLIVLIEPFASQLRDDGTVTLLSVTAFILAIPLNLANPVYLFLAMRRVYGQSRGMTFLKLFLFILGYSVMLSGAVILFYLLIKGVPLLTF